MADTTQLTQIAWSRRRARRDFKIAFFSKLFERRILRIPGGHYYSPVVSRKEIRRDADRVFDTTLRDLPGIDINDDLQVQTLRELSAYYSEHPFSELPNDRTRYFFDNLWFAQTDALVLYCMIRHLNSKRIVEIGSGFSSAVMLDTNEQYFDRSIQLTFVEPESQRLRELLKPRDHAAVEILEQPIQQVGRDRVSELESGDILFIDSSHVTKAGSDVNYIVFELLPSLNPGVVIHFHDVLYPFEYPKRWFELGVSWNEAYLLRAFLQHNSRFKIRFWNDYILRFHTKALENAMPLCVSRPDFGVGGSLWLEKT